MKVLFHYIKKGYKNRRSAYGRAVKKFIAHLDMDNVPEALRNLPDGSRFLQLKGHLMHIYLSQDVVKTVFIYTKGDARFKRVRRWWRTLKGLPFLPQDCLRFVSALTAPPVPAHHPAHTPCSKFLEYLRSTWLEGSLQNMWCKYLVHELRTTNTAENYHSRLRKIIGKNHPPLARLILAFRSLTSIAKVTLMRMEVLRHESRSFRTRDQIRREKVNRAMADFEEVRRSPYLNTIFVERYCREMSRFTSEKVI
ncbi:hypothetical protein OESDEN_18119 [Oesophagostomum dentatum]|uniref:Uncharacterized protein n=1 Tax=Oesophagostomum dentatum TaxID=61180 RepID=A0A0B1SBB3_OESDE|nr:hypothetical protein OESDEN_18119 [Oesophagostomum dentatum]